MNACAAMYLVLYMSVHLCPIAYLKFLIPIQFILHNTIVNICYKISLHSVQHI